MDIKSALPVGTVLDNTYVVEGVLGPGGFAITYLANDQALKRKVALKEFFPAGLAERQGRDVRPPPVPDSISSFQDQLKRFEGEGRVIATVRHPNVVRVHRSFPENGTHYIVLEYIDGLDFDEWLDSLGGPPSQATLDSLIRPLLDAIETVHKANVLHRDITPKNIRLRRAVAPGTTGKPAQIDPAQPVLLDFGAYKAMPLAGIAAASKTIQIGTHGYAALEAMSADASKLGAWTDIYGLASTLYRALSGTRPVVALERALSDELVPATKLPGLDNRYRPAFLAAIDAGLTVRPEGRPKSIAAWRTALFDGTDQLDKKTGRTARPTSNRVPPQPQPAAPPAPAVPSAVTKPPPDVAAGPARRTSAGTIVGALLVLGGAGAIAAVQLELLPQRVSVTPPPAAPLPPPEPRPVTPSPQPPAPVPAPQPPPSPAPTPPTTPPPPPPPQPPPTSPPSTVRPPLSLPPLPPPVPLPIPPRSAGAWERVVPVREVQALARHPDDSRRLVSGTARGAVASWRVGERGEAQSTGEAFDVGEPVRDIAVAPSGAMMVVHGRPGDVTATIRSATGRQNNSGRRNRMHVAFSRATRGFVAVSNLVDGQRRSAQLEQWLPDGAADGAAFVIDDSQTVEAVAFSPDGATVAVARRPDGITILDVIGRQVRRIIPTTQIATSLAFSPDGRVLAVAGQGDNIRLLGLTSGTADRMLAALPAGADVGSLAFSEDGALVAASTSLRTVFVWRVAAPATAPVALPATYSRFWPVVFMTRHTGETTLAYPHDDGVRDVLLDPK